MHSLWTILTTVFFVLYPLTLLLNPLTLLLNPLTLIVETPVLYQSSVRQCRIISGSCIFLQYVCTRTLLWKLFIATLSFCVETFQRKLREIKEKLNMESTKSYHQKKFLHMLGCSIVLPNLVWDILVYVHTIIMNMNMTNQQTKVMKKISTVYVCLNKVWISTTIKVLNGKKIAWQTNDKCLFYNNLLTCTIAVHTCTSTEHCISTLSIPSAFGWI